MVEKINNMQIEIIGSYRGNYSEGIHLRKMGAIVGKSHTGLLPHLKSLEESKVIYVKSVGKNTIYYLNFKNAELKEYISMCEKAVLLELIGRELFVRKIYEEISLIGLDGTVILFGSFASGRKTKASDFDLLFFGRIKENDKKKIVEIGREYGREIHLNCMSYEQFRKALKNESHLVVEILKNHVVLYNSDLFANEIWRYFNERKR